MRRNVAISLRRRRLTFAVLNLRHFGKKFGANAGRHRLVLRVVENFLSACKKWLLSRKARGLFVR
jgi:hypothetical protein